MILWLLLALEIFSMTSFAARDLALVNAKIYSGVELLSQDAILITAGKIEYIGSSADVRTRAGKGVAVVDIKGALVMPGFIEAHGHLLGIGQSKLNLDLKNLSEKDLAQLVHKQAKLRAPGAWIKGRGWDQNLWDNKKFPHKSLFAAIENPIYLRRVDGHAVLVNDVVLKMAGINKKSVSPSGGVIVRDDHGEPTGVLIDNAISLLDKYIQKPSRAELEHYLDLASMHVLSLGVTSFHDAGVDKETLQLYEDFAQTSRLKLRVYAMIDGSDQTTVDAFLLRGPLHIKDFLTVRSIKYFADGALGSRGAYLLEDYHDQPGQRGLLLTSVARLTADTKKALDHGFQVATHAIGDGANRLVLNSYEQALKLSKKHDSRLRVEHAQLIDPEDHKRFKHMAIIASMQPIHCTSDMAWVPERLGNDRLTARAYPWRSLLKHDVVLAFGSDAPVEDANPIQGIFSAVTRASKLHPPSFMPEEKLNLKEALAGYFFGAAYAEFSEHKKGKIAQGYLADLVVFDTDLLHPIKKSFLEAKPLLTIVDGEIRYKRP